MVLHHPSLCSTGILGHGYLVTFPQIFNPLHQFRAKAEMASAHDAQRGVQPLPPLRPGTTVMIQDGHQDPKKHWVVVEQQGRQVGVSDGKKILLRNRQQVRSFEPGWQDHDTPVDRGVSSGGRPHAEEHYNEKSMKEQCCAEQPMITQAGVDLRKKVEKTQEQRCEEPAIADTGVESGRNDHSQLATAALKPTSCFSEGVIKEGAIT